MVNPDAVQDTALQVAHDEPSDVDAERVPLVDIVDPNHKAGEEEVVATQENAENAEESTMKKKVCADFQGLTKEQLQEFVNDPFWKRLRLILFVLFWIVWVGMLAAVVIIILVAPKCPPRPTREFWQKPFYRIQVKSFAPSTGDNPTAAGTIVGLAKKMDYLHQTLGFNNFILDSLVGTHAASGCPVDFKSSNSSVVDMAALKALTKLGRKKGFSFVMEFDASQADVDWPPGASDGFHRASGAYGASPKMASRNGGEAWNSDVLHLPKKSCRSINVTSPRVLASMEEALSHWLDAGMSGFVLTNVAFMSPSADVAAAANLSTVNWFNADPTPVLFSNASVNFVHWVRRFLVAQSEVRGRPIALFVDPGNTGFPQPEDRLAAYLDPVLGAHAVVSTGLGTPLSPMAAKEPRSARQLIKDTLTAVKETGSVAFATAWPSMRRPEQSFWSALSLTLPGVPCLYYGQELGMTHVAGVTLSGNGRTSYLTGADSTDVSETPMQWSGNLANAGWLENGTTPLAWVGLSPRARDIELHNLRRLSAAGHPSSELQLVQRLVKLIGSVESLQWGNLTFLETASSTQTNSLIVFKRQAEQFPPVVVVVNSGNKSATLDLSEAGSPKGTLKVMHSSDPSASSSFLPDQDYSFDRVFAPAGSILVFLGKDAEV